MGLLRESGGLAAKILNNIGVEITAVRSAIESVLGRTERSRVQQITPTSQVKKVIEISFNEARRIRNNYVGTEHLLLGLLIENEGIAAHVLRQFGADLETVRERLSQMSVTAEAEATDADHRQDPPASLQNHRGVERVPSNADGRLIAEVVSRAVALADERGEVLGTEHFLLALAGQDSTKTGEILERHGLTRAAIETTLDNLPPTHMPGAPRR